MPQLLLTLAFFLGISLAPGCRSTGKPESSAFASVELHGNTPGQIRAVALEVFHDHGYTAANAPAGREVFEKKGSHLNNLAYGNWAGTPIWVRFKTRLISVGEAAFRLEGQAFLVRGKDEPVEEEIPVSRFHARSYQKILDEVAQRLHSAPRT